MLKPVPLPNGSTAPDQFSMFLDDIPFDAKDGRPFVIADYGCQDGGVSVPLIRHFVGEGNIV